jgi:hypothetical protein
MLPPPGRKHCLRSWKGVGAGAVGPQRSRARPTGAANRFTLDRCGIRSRRILEERKRNARVACYNAPPTSGIAKWGKAITPQNTGEAINATFFLAETYANT